jgi:hypothetical protein
VRSLYIRSRKKNQPLADAGLKLGSLRIDTEQRF